MAVIAYDDWMQSECITIDEDGWKCSEDAPEEIKKKFNEFMALANDGCKMVIEGD